MSTPTPTPMAKLCVATLTSMTAVSLWGIVRRVESLMLCQSKAATETKIITATSAALGISATMSLRADSDQIHRVTDRSMWVIVRNPMGPKTAAVVTDAGPALISR